MELRKQEDPQFVGIFEIELFINSKMLYDDHTSYFLVFSLTYMRPFRKWVASLLIF